MPDPTANRCFFLGLSQPPLVAAAQWLVAAEINAFPDRASINMQDFVLVLPTFRSTQRLMQLLVRESAQVGLPLIPPTITTVGQLPEHLYVAEKQLASDLAQQLAWSQALAETPKAELEILTGRPEVENLQEWQPLATMISRLHTRLANDIWSFRSVAREVKKDDGFLKEEAARWDVLNAMQQRYYTILHSVNLWDRQAARNYAAAGLLKADEIRCSTDKQIVLIGAADLNRSVSEMVRQVQTANPLQVTILIAAEESMSDRFDDFGCLITERWLETQVDIDDEQILIVDQPADQADAAAYFLTNLPDGFFTDEMTIGVPDMEIVPQLQRSLNAIGVEHRNLAGKPLAETSPVLLMLAAKDHLESQDFASFARLIRHPELHDWLCDQTGMHDWLRDLDEFQNNRLPHLISLHRPFPFGSPSDVAADFDPADDGGEKRAKRAAAVSESLNRIHQLVAELLTPLAGSPRPIADWTQPWSEILIAVYGNRVLDSLDYQDRQIIKACDTVYTALGNQRQVPAEFGTETDASQALDWAIQAAAETRVIPPAIPSAIELAGWLDLALDDAAVMVVTGMNDEHVPASEVGHQFLPNELCKQLGIVDNDRRYARDIYALTVITSVREQLRLIVGRRNEKGEPKKPSRLLFATDAATSARRARAFFSYEGEPRSRFWITDQQEHDLPQEQPLAVPEPICHQPLKKLSVTKFRSYIKCPYRFYLKHVLRLDSIADDWTELSGGTFGDLCHNVLETFGRSDQRDLDDAEKIAEYWMDTLDEFVKRRYSTSQLPSVRIQIEQLRLRLQKFAPMQAERRRQGWQIVSTEEMLEHEFVVEGEPFIIRGKIDRVDRHESTGQLAVWDYKSSDKGEPPERVHFAPRQKTWKDLQLPLYRHLVKEVEAVAGADFSNVIMGYILLPKKLEDVGFSQANWTADQLVTADNEAKRIIREIRANHFWPPNPDPPQYSQEFAAICQDDVFEKFAIAAGEEKPPW
ncbi:MAG: PD-(D/E)XK nuclease family protein [Planctomycetota bacterium]